MKPESVVIAGYYGFGNAGDELILYSLIRRLRRENPDVEITVLSQTPSKTAQEFNVNAVDRWRPWTWFSPLFHASRFILGGGGLLQESTGPWNHFYYLSLLFTAKLFGCRTETLSIGVDPMQRTFNRFWTRFVLNHWVDAISVRDEVSRQALRASGVLFPIDVHPDPVFDLKIERHARSSGRIALAVSPSKTHRLWSRGIAELCDLLAKRLDVSVDLLVFFPKDDEPFAQDIIKHAAFEPHMRVWNNPSDVLSWIPQYDLMIATRFHALVLAAMSHTPFIGWGAHPKVATLCEASCSPYVNTEQTWDVTDQLNRIVSLHHSSNKNGKVLDNLNALRGLEEFIK